MSPLDLLRPFPDLSIREVAVTPDLVCIGVLDSPDVLPLLLQTADDD